MGKGLEWFFSILLIGFAGWVVFSINKCNSYVDQVHIENELKQKNCRPVCAPYHVANDFDNSGPCVCDMTRKDVGGVE